LQKEAIMTVGRIVGIALLALGVVMLVFGFTATDALVERAAKTVTGRYSDQTMFLIIGGIVSAVVGLGLTIFGGRRGTT